MKKKTILTFLITCIILCVISLVAYLIFKKYDINSITSLQNFIKKFHGTAWLVFVVLEVLLSVPIFVLPFEDELWVGLSIILFGVWKGFMLSVVAMLFVSSILYLGGKYLGLKLFTKLIGKKEFDSVVEKFNTKNVLSLPFLYLIPMFPHDVLCVISGVNRINFLYFFFVTLILRSLEIVAICFLGGSLVNFKTFSSIDWLMFVNLLLVDIYLIIKLQKIMLGYLQRKKQEKENNINNK